MFSTFLLTFISCNQLNRIITKLENVASLTPIQKKEIVIELKKVVPSCPIIIQKN
jgi:hypothetical protein